jgi:hypothetical protein
MPLIYKNRPVITGAVLVPNGERVAIQEPGLILNLNFVEGTGATVEPEGNGLRLIGFNNALGEAFTATGFEKDGVMHNMAMIVHSYGNGIRLVHYTLYPA